MNHSKYPVSLRSLTHSNSTKCPCWSIVLGIDVNYSKAALTLWCP